MTPKPRRVVLASGTVRASLLACWLETGVQNWPLALSEKDTQDLYGKTVRLVAEILDEGGSR